MYHAKSRPIRLPGWPQLLTLSEHLLATCGAIEHRVGNPEHIPTSQSGAPHASPAIPHGIKDPEGWASLAPEARSVGRVLNITEDLAASAPAYKTFPRYAPPDDVDMFPNPRLLLRFQQQVRREGMLIAAIEH
jgi:hypothetical protein